MRFYHGTDVLFESFSLDFAAHPGAASNGFLGIWLAKDRELAQRFGIHVLAVDVESVKAYNMTIGELSSLHFECGRSCDSREEERIFYARIREEQLRNGYDFINIVEVSGIAAMGIGLMPEKLTIVA